MPPSIKLFLSIAVLLLSLPLKPILAQHDGRYSFKYPGDFFSPGGQETGFTPGAHRKIGILIQNRTALPLSKIASLIFHTPPFDRYGQFFYFRLEEEFQEDLAGKNILSTRAYDYSGRPIAGGLPISAGQGAFNLIFLRFGPREVIRRR